jgi:2-polyprenyl-3-methyl-5-hydroxy-6-metoxy-1,4-benzoquinol methylase
MVLEHVPASDSALKNMVAAVKRGGWILIEELDHITLLPDLSVAA